MKKRNFMFMKGLAIISLVFSSVAMALPTVTMTQSIPKAVAGRNFVSLTATATPTVGSMITKVEFYRKLGTTDTLLYTDTRATNNDKKYHYVLWNLTAGTYTYFARAFDSTGNASTGIVTVQVISTPDRDPNGDSIDLSAVIAHAKDRGKYKVVNSADFSIQAASLANPGDVIALQGTPTMAFFGASFTRSGTSTDPIVYVPVSGVAFSSSGGQWKIKGSDIVVTGFNFSKFDNGNTIVVLEGAQRCRLSGNTFLNIGAGSNMASIIRLVSNSSNITASNNRLDHNTMIGNLSFGMQVLLPEPISSSARQTFANGLTTTAINDEYTPLFVGNRFDHNIYKDIIGNPQQRIPLQTGNLPDHLVYKTDAVIDNNTFTNNTEGINSKSTGESYLFNFFESIKDTAIGFRAGDSKRAEGNLFKNVDRAITIVGQNQMIVNNIVDNNLSGIVTQDGFMIHKWGSVCKVSQPGCSCIIAAPAPTPATDPNSSANLPSACTYYGKTGNNMIGFNTIRNVKTSAVELDRIWGNDTDRADLQPTGTKLVNNIFSNDGSGASTTAILVQDADSTDGKAPNATITKNLYYGARSGITGTSPVVGVAPALSSTYTPNASSPALNVGVDIAGVVRDHYFRARKIGTASDLGAVERP